MSDKRIIEVSSCENCPCLKETTQDAGLFYCPYDLNNFFRDGLNNVRKNCPLPKKEKIEDRTCRNCNYYKQIDAYSEDDNRGILVKVKCLKYKLSLGYLPRINKDFINDPNKHCWEKRDE